MNTVFVWILILHSWDGGMLKVENIRSWEDCERLRIRAEQSATPRRPGATVLGSCTEVGVLVPNQAAPVVHVQPASAPIVKNVIVVRKP